MLSLVKSRQCYPWTEIGSWFQLWATVTSVHQPMLGNRKYDRLVSCKPTMPLIKSNS